MSRFDGKTVMVTGAAGALGRSMVRGFAAEGARLVAGARREEQVADLVAELGDRARSRPSTSATRRPGPPPC
jgi:NAD(P)-dependent dehydrogenase (short-subunit alcohol dehydrogenase family)